MADRRPSVGSSKVIGVVPLFFCTVTLVVLSCPRPLWHIIILLHLAPTSSG
ncbi:unnamed protein product [Amoebophrya sp. A120]|nr:unnamed protein product [Amoebophrya sp. A120]|eukprot:GSA120T00024901001.1